MPSRTFRIYIANATSVPLTKVKNDGHLHGAFTPGGWVPPDTIPPGQTLAFQAESDGLLQGTDGHVVYQIEDGKMVADRVRIDWNNPWIGTTNSVGGMQVSTGFFEDRTNGDSAEFVIEGGGRRPTGDDTGPIITAGWVEVVPGLVALPIPNLGVEPHAWSMFAVRDRPSTSSGLSTSTSFGTAATPPTLDFEPMVGAKSNAWQGTWDFGSGNSSVKVTIEQNKVAPNSVAAVMGYQQFTVSIEERSSAGGTVSMSQPAVVEEVVSAFRFLNGTWPPIGAPLKLTPRVGAQNLRTTVSLTSALSAAATPAAPAASSLSRSFRLNGTDFELASVRTAPASAGVSTSRPTAGAVIQPQVAPTFGAAVSATPQLLLDEADGLAIEQGRVTLMLYVARNALSGEPMGFGVRYTRRHWDGEMAADVMLAPAFRGPH